MRLHGEELENHRLRSPRSTLEGGWAGSSQDAGADAEGCSGWRRIEHLHPDQCEGHNEPLATGPVDVGARLRTKRALSGGSGRKAHRTALRCCDDDHDARIHRRWTPGHFRAAATCFLCSDLVEEVLRINGDGSPGLLSCYIVDSWRMIRLSRCSAKRTPGDEDSRGV